MNLGERLFAGQEEQAQAKLARLLCLFMLALPVFVLGVLPESVNGYLEYNRDKVLSGQVWRLISCNFVHLSSNHMFMNLSVYVLATLIFASSLSISVWYGCLGLCSISVGLGLLIFDTKVVSYVGLSGVLYGMLVFGLLANLKHNRLIYLLAYGYICFKVCTQQLSSYDPEEMKSFIGGNVIASAHLFGLIAGNIAALSMCIRKIWFKSGEK